MRELLELRAVGGVDRRLGAALERDPLRDLARDLPVDRPRRLEDPHHLAEVDLREVERWTGRMSAFARRRGRAGRPGGRRALVVVGLVGVSRLRTVGHAVSVWGCIPSRSPAHPDSWAVVSCPCSPRIPTSTRVLGLDVREPERQAAAVEFARVDIAGTELKPLLEGIDVVVHLAGVVDPIARRAAHGAGQRRGHAPRARRRGRGRRPRIVRISSATVYGAWPNNPVPLTEDAALRPNPDFSPAVQGAEVERLLAEWRGEHPEVTVTTLRSAPVVGPGAERLPARILLGRPPLRVRGAARRCRSCTSTTSPPRSTLAATRDLPGVYNVAADGWLDADEARALSAVRPRPRCRPRCSSAGCGARGTSGSATSPRASCRTSCTRG